MRQLSGADSMFLQFERGNNFMHVASLAIYDPSTAPGGGVRFKDVLRHFATRIAQFPQFRRRLVSLPLSLDRPYWVESDSIDVEFHVRHIAVPHPGDWRQLCIQVARLHSRPLDRSKPLWEAYVIEGLHNVPGVPPGSFALYTKMHHAIVDGESGTEIMRELHSLTPESIDFDAEERSASGIYHADREPTLVELYSRALAHNVQKLPGIARFSLDTARKVASLGADALTKFNNLGEGGFIANVRALLTGDLSTLLPRMPPQTSFSGDVSAHRVFEAISLPLADFRAIREQVPKATINDLFLIEREVAGLSDAERLAVRKERSAPLVDGFYTWVKALVPKVRPGSKLGDAVGYAIGQEPRMRLFLAHGDVPFHNNLSELLLRQPIVGRKNWLFNGSEGGARAAADWFSLIASCRMQRIDPWSYLYDVFGRLPDHSSKRVHELTPLNWRLAVENGDIVPRSPGRGP